MRGYKKYLKEISCGSLPEWVITDIANRLETQDDIIADIYQMCQSILRSNDSHERKYVAEKIIEILYRRRQPIEECEHG